MQGDPPEGVPRQRAREVPQVAHLPVAPLRAGRAPLGRAGRVEAVDHDLPHRNPEALQLVHQRRRLVKAQGLGQRHRHETATPGILQKPFHPPLRGGQSFQKGVQLVAAIEAAVEPLHVAMLGQQRIQDLEPSAPEPRHGQEPQGVARGGGVHQDAIVAPPLGPAGDLQEGHHLVQARKRQVQQSADVLVV